MVEGKMRRAGSLPGKKALKTVYICKELAYVIMETGTFKIWRVSQQAGEKEELMVKFESEGHQAEDSEIS